MLGRGALDRDGVLGAGRVVLGRVVVGLVVEGREVDGREVLGREVLGRDVLGLDVLGLDLLGRDVWDRELVLEDWLREAPLRELLRDALLRDDCGRAEDRLEDRCGVEREVRDGLDERLVRCGSAPAGDVLGVGAAELGTAARVGRASTRAVRAPAVAPSQARSGRRLD